MSSFELDSWQSLPSEGAEWLAFDDDRLAVAGPARLNIWQGEKLLRTANAPSPAPGVPRFDGNHVYWGPGIIDLASGDYRMIEDAQPPVWPGSAVRPLVYAWSPHGERLVGSFGTADSSRPTIVTLFNGVTGAALASLWDGSGVPPQAAWIGESVVVTGFGDPQVFDHSGRHLADIALGGATITALQATSSEHRLIAVDLNRALAWIDTATWTVLDRWDGPWLHGAVSPDGRFVAALETWGKLHFACLARDRFIPAGQTSADPTAFVVALSEGEIATVGGGEARRAGIRIDCSAAPPG